LDDKALHSVDRKSRVYKKCKDKDHPAAKEIKTAKRNFEEKLAQNIKLILNVLRKFVNKVTRENLNWMTKRCTVLIEKVDSFFAYARSKTKSKIQAESILSDSGTLLDCDIKIAQWFNEYFSSVITAENTITLPVPEPLESQQDLSPFSHLQFDVESVHRVLSKLRPDKSMGPDGLASMLLIETQDLITYPLYLLFKKSLKDTYS